MGLVKQICVSSNTIESGFNKPYVRLLSVSQEGGFKAKIEWDVIWARTAKYRERH